MKKKFYIPVAAAFLCILALFIGIFSDKLMGQNNVNAKKNASPIIPAFAPTTLPLEKKLSPVAHLDKMVAEARYRQQLKDFEQNLIQQKKAGKRFWGGTTPYKDPIYFQGLNTNKLAEECFNDTLFFFEMSIYDDPNFPIIRLRVCHNGFAELFRRKDLWAGILHAYKFLGKKISPSTEAKEFIQASTTLDSLKYFFIYPDFKNQFQGHEDALMRVQLEIIKKYRDLADFYVNKNEKHILFFCEPTDTSNAFLDLARQKDELIYQNIYAQIQDFHFSQVQKMEEMKEYLDLFIAAAEKYIK